MNVEDIQWDRFPLINSCASARSWLVMQVKLRLASNTIDAYGRGLEDYLFFCLQHHIEPLQAGREQIAAYVYDLTSRPNPRGANIIVLDSGAGLANATLQQRLTVVRLFYDYLVEKSIRNDNPVGRGRYTPGKGFGGARDRGLIPRYRKLPWIPTDEQWQAILLATREEPLRNRFMLALAYDAGLRREELCSLETHDIDPAHRTVTIRAETTKNNSSRVVVYSRATDDLYNAYLRDRRRISRDRGPLFLSESKRNWARPITKWTWSKVIEGIAHRSGVERFTTHTLRHLCLTDLARSNWDIHDIATFAGHRSIETTTLYIHLSGRDLAEKLEASMSSIHAMRAKGLSEALK
jgi:site-specific recombinase XerD